MALKNQTKTAAINIKFESHDNPNEFSSGYYIRWPEICVIFFILVLWMLSLRKFFKHFEKIRNIHYREIPFKYKLKDPQNLSKIRVCRYPSQGVIFTNDPIANVTQSRQYSMCSELMMTPKNSLIRQSSIFPNEEFDSLKRKLNIVISEADEYKSFEMIDSNDANDGSLNDLYANNKSLNSNYELSVTTENSIPKVNDLNEPQSNSLTSLQHNNSIKKLYERDRLHSSMHTDERIYDRFNTTQRRKIFKNEKKISFNSHLNSLSVSTIVKKGMYDLHKRSLERLNFKRGNYLKSPSRDGKRSSLVADFETTKQNNLNKIANRMVTMRYSDADNQFYKIPSTESFV